MSRVYVIMGVSGCGKSTIGKLLSKHIAKPFYEGDDFHCINNIEKMKNGIPLTTQDRMPWLASIAGRIVEWSADGGAVLSCSALKESYRTVLATGNNVQFIHLEGDYDMIYNRLKQRTGHFFKEELLQSQFDDLEPPVNAITVSVDQNIEDILMEILKQIGNA